MGNGGVRVGLLGGGESVQGENRSNRRTVRRDGIGCQGARKSLKSEIFRVTVVNIDVVAFVNIWRVCVNFECCYGCKTCYGFGFG